LSEPARNLLQPLAADEVRVYTLATGESAAAHAATRRILASLLGVAIPDVEMFDAPKGKPLLRNDSSLHFSISHSRNMSMIAVTRVAPVGVDIEQLRAVPNAEAILRRFFSPEQIGTILSDENRDLRFVEAWTRAEATVKVCGASVWEVATPDPSTTVRQILAPDGFAAAVAVASAEWAVVQHSISDAGIVAL